MKKPDASFKTLVLITLFLLYAILQTTHALLMLSNRHADSKMVERGKIIGTESRHSKVKSK
jgi:hypothetical protein